MNYALAQVQIAEVRDRLHRRRISVRRGDKLQQPHVTRRIEEVGAEPVAPEIFREAFDNFCYRQAAGVGGDDGAGFANGFDLAQQGALDLHVFDDGFDDPIDFGELLQIVLKVSDRDQPRQRRLKEGGGLGLHRSFQTGSGNAVARRTIRIRRNDIEQVGRNTGIGQVRGDASAHGARAQNGNFLYPSLHEVFR